MEYFNNILLGAHTSISGGMDKALDKAYKLNCTTVQIFTKNQLRWNSPGLKKEQVNLFKQKFFKYQGIKRIIAHSSYLINLASSNNDIAKKSINSIILELDRAVKLGIALYVLHPGFHNGIGMKNGIKNIAGRLKGVISEYGKNVIICIETMAGQGSSIGSKFEELSEIMDKSGGGSIGVCFDTCHVFASGYDIRKNEGYFKTMDEFSRLIGLENIKVIHLNDSKGDLASRIDRHMHIGMGKIGVNAFKLIMNDARFQGVSKIIETPKEKYPDKYDRMNLNFLRRLIDVQD